MPTPTFPILSPAFRVELSRPSCTSSPLSNFIFCNLTHLIRTYNNSKISATIAGSVIPLTRVYVCVSLHPSPPFLNAEFPLNANTTTCIHVHDDKILMHPVHTAISSPKCM